MVNKQQRLSRVDRLDFSFQPSLRQPPRGTLNRWGSWRGTRVLYFHQFSMRRKAGGGGGVAAGGEEGIITKTFY